MTRKIKQGEVWLANLNPTRGTEPGKCRPVSTSIDTDRATYDKIN